MTQIRVLIIVLLGLVWHGLCDLPTASAKADSSAEKAIDLNAPAREPYQELLEHFSFVPLVHTYQGKRGQSREYRYRLFDPQLQLNEKLPLIVWLHGSMECGDDNQTQLRHLERTLFLPPYDGKKSYPFYVLLVQCPSDNLLWQHDPDSDEGDEMIDVLYSILTDVLRDRPIDRARISLAGIGRGGSACWELAARHPDLFSCMLTMRSRAGDPATFLRLLDLPVWMFFNKLEVDAPIEDLRAAAEKFKQLGGTLELTFFTAASPDCWSDAFQKFYALDWLLSRRRLDQGSTSERIAFWLDHTQAPIIAAEVAGMLALLWGARRLARSRRSA